MGDYDIETLVVRSTWFCETMEGTWCLNFAATRPAVYYSFGIAFYSWVIIVLRCLPTCTMVRKKSVCFQQNFLALTWKRDRAVEPGDGAILGQESNWWFGFVKIVVPFFYYRKQRPLAEWNLVFVRWNDTLFQWLWHIYWASNRKVSRGFERVFWSSDDSYTWMV